MQRDYIFAIEGFCIVFKLNHCSLLQRNQDYKYILDDHLQFKWGPTTIYRWARPIVGPGWGGLAHRVFLKEFEWFWTWGWDEWVGITGAQSAGIVFASFGAPLHGRCDTYVKANRPSGGYAVRGVFPPDPKSYWINERESHGPQRQAMTQWRAGTTLNWQT